MDQLLRPQILVFLPQAAADLISVRLIEVGYLAAVANSIPDLRAAFESAEYDIVVTTRPEIDTVRNIKPLPVINLEVFFHPDPRETLPDIGKKQFDFKAFLGRVKVLTEHGRARAKHSAAQAATSPAGRGDRLWQRFGFDRCLIPRLSS